MRARPDVTQRQGWAVSVPVRTLGGRQILVTRPLHQAAALADLIAAADGEPVLFPTIEIAAAVDPAPLAEAVASRGEIDLAIFTSANAVGFAWPALRAAGGLSSRVKIAAMGEGTAAALAAFGVVDVLIPAAGADTESLLERAELRDVAGVRAFVFTGEGGRRLLAEALAARGARLTTVACYRRRRPIADPAPLERHLAAAAIAAVTASSGEGLGNLFEMVGARARAVLCTLPVFVAHERIAAAAIALGIGHAEVCGSGDRATVAALLAHFATASAARPA